MTKLMKPILVVLAIFIISISACHHTKPLPEVKILFLHHSVGENIWEGDQKTLLSRLVHKIYKSSSDRFERKPNVIRIMDSYKRENNRNYSIENQMFPKEHPYGWNNFPYDYYNIWVKNAGNHAYMEEPTLEMLTKEYNVIIFKHCFPVSNIQADLGSANADTSFKSLENYKLQYLSLRDKMHEFPDTKFIVWTGAAQVKSQITEKEAMRAKEFFTWVANTWDIPDENIFIWDFYQLQTKGGIYFPDGCARTPDDSHPNRTFAKYAGELFANRIIDVIEKNGIKTNNKGETLK